MFLKGPSFADVPPSQKMFSFLQIGYFSGAGAEKMWVLSKHDGKSDPFSVDNNPASYKVSLYFYI